MDELATDSTGHRQKIIGQFGSLGRAFHITPEGDVKMPFHITICLTFCETGIYSFLSSKVEGAPPPLVIHSNSRTENSGKKDNVDPEKKKSFRLFLPKPHVRRGPSDQGKDKTPIILLVDGHASR